MDFVQSMQLPSQLAQVDPIVASFCGGSVGVLSALLVVEINNVKKHKKNRCGAHGCAALARRWLDGAVHWRVPCDASACRMTKMVAVRISIGSPLVLSTGAINVLLCASVCTV